MSPMSPMYRALIWMYELGNSLMWSLAILSVPFWFYVALYAAPKAQLITQQQQQNAIWWENRLFCERHGMSVGTHAHTQCVKDLTELRTQEDQRFASEVEGIF